MDKTSSSSPSIIFAKNRFWGQTSGRGKGFIKGEWVCVWGGGQGPESPQLWIILGQKLYSKTQYLMCFISGRNTRVLLIKSRNLSARKFRMTWQWICLNHNQNFKNLDNAQNSVSKGEQMLSMFFPIYPTSIIFNAEFCT